jgi:alanine racemase
MYLVSEIANVVEGKVLQLSTDAEIEHLGYDSRRIPQGERTLFFALITSHADGHQYIKDAYKKGVRNFVISKESFALDCEDSNVVLVTDTLKALQTLAAFHRRKFNIPVIGITGSNGKTIVKEWLYQLLQKDYNIVRSPKSFNSQVGVPLSVWQINEQHTLAIFEAGISTVGEMGYLQPVIQPTIGILTNIGEAHDEGFTTRKEKTYEKLELFKTAQCLIYPYHSLQTVFGNDPLPIPAAVDTISWCSDGDCSFHIIHRKVIEGYCSLKASYNGKGYSLQVPFTDDASIENAINCWCLMIYLGYEDGTINDRFKQLHKVEMRLQLVHAINNCVLINDSYSADLTSLQFALQFLVQQSAGLKRTVIISDFFQSGKDEKELYAGIVNMLISHGIEKVIAIGEKIGKYLSPALSDSQVELYAYPDT